MTEFLSRFFGMRARSLRKWIKLAFADGTRDSGRKPDEPQSTSKSFFSHALVAPMHFGPKKYPSYVDAKTFATVLIDMASEETLNPEATVETLTNDIESGPLPQGLRKVLVAQLESVGKLDELNDAIAAWFDSSMNRVSGWYKRHMQILTLVLGAIVALLLGADSLSIASTFWQNQSVRSSTAAQVEQYLQDHPSAPSSGSEASTGNSPGTTTADAQSRIEALLTQLQATALPLFWQDAQQCQVFGTVVFGKSERKNDTQQASSAPCSGIPRSSLLLFILGLVVTTVAVSFGARFWFDLLTKLVNIRMSGGASTSVTEPAKAKTP